MPPPRARPRKERSRDTRILARPKHAPPGLHGQPPCAEPLRTQARRRATGAGFRFSYGPGSFARHRAEAARIALPVRLVRAPLLAWDVDLPADLDFAGARTPTRP